MDKLTRIASLLLGVALAWCCVLPASAQFVGGEWVQRGEANIRKYRMTDVAFLVLDAEGRIAEGAKVHLEQQRHAFTLGWVLRGEFPADFRGEEELWRAFNAVSLEELTSWRRVQPDGPADFRTVAIDEALAKSDAAGLTLHWGSLLSADTFDLPEWVVPLRDAELYAAARDYALDVGRAYGDWITGLDLCEDTIDHDRFPPAVLRLVGAHLRVAAPDVRLGLRYDEAWQGSKAFEVLGAMDVAVGERMPIAGFTVSQRFGPGPIAQENIEPGLLRLAKFGRSLVVTGLEIGGTNGIETTVNAETVLRTLFAEPTVSGIYFAGLRAGDFADPSAALFDEEGQPSGAGQTIDRLFRQTWWSNVTATSDELGRARARVFLGDYTVTATLADGSSVTMPLRLRDRIASPQPIILMPIAPASEAAVSVPTE